MSKRKNHKPAFKARVALEAINGEQSVRLHIKWHRFKSALRESLLTFVD